MYQLNNAIFRFRFMQLGITIREIPIVYHIIIAGLLFFFGWALFRLMSSETASLIIACVFLFSIFMIHANRNDYRFIFLIEEHPWRIFTLEYILLSIPFLLAAGIYGQLWPILLIIIGCILVGCQNRRIHRAKFYFPIPRILPFQAFEYRTGIRRYGLLLVLFYVLALAGLFFPYASLAILWVIILSLTDFFRISEPLNILCVDELSPLKFLYRKLRLNVGLYIVISFPLCLAYAFIYPADWWIPLYFFLYGIVNVCLVIVSKYAFYRPQEKIIAGQIGITLSFFGMLIPLLFPLTLFYLIKNYIRARQNLKNYLDAYDTGSTCRI